MTGRRDRIFCSARCRQIGHGLRLPAPLVARACALDGCDRTFAPKSRRQRCCAERHGQVLWNRESRADGRQPNAPWGDRRRSNYHARRARLNGGRNGDRVMTGDVIQRDGLTCSWCGQSIDLDIQWPDPLSRSLDHIVPLSRGGAHELANVQLLHLGCNVRKGAATA